jgi:pimeloyl-ACP methyl ester carboxylesterase
MKNTYATLLALIAVLLVDGIQRAESHDGIGSKWETAAIDHRGPDAANGLLLYFHGYNGRDEVAQKPLPELLIQMARVAEWDVLRINRAAAVDHESDDDHILQFVADRIAGERAKGYKQVIVAGASRGGWLALLAATLPAVDAAIALAPVTVSYNVTDLRRTRDALAQKLATAKVGRIAAFFFDGDPAEDVSERRAVVLRRALQANGATFMLVDRPPGLYGHGAAIHEEFVDHYRDCLLQFVRNPDQPAGEVRCIGAESAGLAGPPADAYPPLTPYWGRWQGVDEIGAHVTMEALDIRVNAILFYFIRSPRPGSDFGMLAGLQLPFQFDAAQRRLFNKLPKGHDMLLARLASATELEVELRLGDPWRPQIWRSQAVLRKQIDNAPGR